MRFLSSSASCSWRSWSWVSFSMQRTSARCRLDSSSLKRLWTSRRLADSSVSPPSPPSCRCTSRSRRSLPSSLCCTSMRLEISVANCCCRSRTISPVISACSSSSTLARFSVSCCRSASSCTSFSTALFSASRRTDCSALSCCWSSSIAFGTAACPCVSGALAESSATCFLHSSVSSSAFRRKVSAASRRASNSAAACPAASSRAFSANSARCFSPATASSSLATFSSVPVRWLAKASSSVDSRSCSSCESFAC
mmetsp:Transcript_33429/g.77645  ORF Transcript_33429/g.77645 Transcript_33429/m.77645 type:complete len:254 (+) Transcript_33429:1010-1771(+)